MLNWVVGPREIVRHENVPFTPEQTWQLVDQWTRSVGLELIDVDGISRVYGPQRGVVAQLRRVIRTVVGQPRFDGIDSMTCTVTTGNTDPVTELIIRVDRSTQRETTSWTGGGIIGGGSGASAYLANTTSMWPWLIGIPVAVFIGMSYFYDNKKSMSHIYASLDVAIAAIATGEQPQRQRDAVLQKMKSVRCSP